ncbi:MAG: FAD-dependent oxidoreductase [Ruminococcaceae bacterium]|nr:FAD-dependent oxidoreductase [Oscillospiraceae bacterium]
MESYVYAKQMPVRYDVDVCVVGGGPAGVAAGITAARAGAKVMILESQGFFGGGGTAALVPAFMQFGNGVDFMAGGIGREVFRRVCIPELAMGIRPEVLKRAYDEMVTESGADFLFHATVADVITRDGGIDAVIVAAKSGMYAVKAKVFVDGTGDGDICAWGGAPVELGDATGHMMPSTVCSMWADIDWDTIPHPTREEKFETVVRAMNDGVFTQEDYHLSGIWRTGEHMGGGNIGHCFGVDATDERSLTEAMVLGRKIMPEFEKFYREYMGGGYENATIVSSGSYLGVRESRRVMGDYVLGVNDFRADSYFDDEIGRYSYPIDIHPDPGRENYRKFLAEHTSMHLKRGESYSIPYRCLCPQKLSNVLVAGRCVSTDQKMQSSIRVMPGCYITGMAAGMAAAIAAEGEQDIRRVDIHCLQDKLAAAGAWLPNHK